MSHWRLWIRCTTNAVDRIPVEYGRPIMEPLTTGLGEVYHFTVKGSLPGVALRDILEEIVEESYHQHDDGGDYDRFSALIPQARGVLSHGFSPFIGFVQGAICSFKSSK